jgi:SAM-dependent methyltransferase
MKTIYELLGREAVHPFPARMAPNVAGDFLENIGRAKCVLDPMMGSGTVLALARRYDHRAFGVDLDPLAVLISRVWTTAIDRDHVREAGANVLARARERFGTTSVAAAYPPTADADTRAFIRYWFDAYARRQLAALAAEITDIEDPPVRDVLWCALSRLIISKQAGASLAMDLSHSRPHKVFHTAPVKPFTRFKAAVERIASNCLSRRERRRGPATDVREGDARALFLPDESIDLVLTSPPYLNAIDYMRCSKFSLVWMGYGLRPLRHVRAISVGTEAGSSQDGTELSREVVGKLSLQPELALRERRMLLRYVDDMAASIREVSRVLRGGGQAVYVIGENTVRGTYIKNSAIIAAVAADCGLCLADTTTRDLPANRRYLPPPALTPAAALDARMRREVVLTFTK